jgi:hypothetical protein
MKIKLGRSEVKTARFTSVDTVHKALEFRCAFVKRAQIMKKI